MDGSDGLPSHRYRLVDDLPEGDAARKGRHNNSIPAFRLLAEEDTVIQASHHIITPLVNGTGPDGGIVGICACPHRGLSFFGSTKKHMKHRTKQVVWQRISVPTLRTPTTPHTKQQRTTGQISSTRTTRPRSPADLRSDCLKNVLPFSTMCSLPTPSRAFTP